MQVRTGTGTVIAGSQPAVMAVALLLLHTHTHTIHRQFEDGGRTMVGKVWRLSFQKRVDRRPAAAAAAAAVALAQMTGHVPDVAATKEVSATCTAIRQSGCGTRVTFARVGALASRRPSSRAYPRRGVWGRWAGVRGTSEVDIAPIIQRRG